MEYTVHTVTGEDDQRWPWWWITLEQCHCASANSAHPPSPSSHLATQWTQTRVCNRKRRSESAFVSSYKTHYAFDCRTYVGFQPLFCHFEYILSKCVCACVFSLFSILSFLPSCRRSTALWRQWYPSAATAVWMGVTFNDWAHAGLFSTNNSFVLFLLRCYSYFALFIVAVYVDNGASCRGNEMLTYDGVSAPWTVAR